MKKDKFIECGYVLLSAREEYYDNVQKAEEIFLARLKQIEKQYKERIFTEQALAEMKYGMRTYDAQLILETYLDNEANMYSNVLDSFIGINEDRFGIALY